MSKPVTVEWGLEISAVTTVSAVVLLLIGLSDVLEWWFDLGGWGFYLLAVGVLLLIVGIVWFFSILSRIKRFKALMLEKSKAAFVRSLDDLEYTAWRLPSKYEDMVLEKEREMGIR